MKRFILPFVLALVAGVGIASGAAVMTAKPVAPVISADSAARLAADTSGLRVVGSPPAGTAKTSATAGATHADSAQHHDSASAKIVLASAPVAPTRPVATVPMPGAQAAADAAAPPPEKRIARVIAAMQPRDAAKVFTQMTDHDVAIIMGNLTEKQEAAILAQLPPDRLAAITKLALKSTPSVK
jgi:hypothetical protein